MKKIDFKKELNEFYSAGSAPKEVVVPEMNFLMIDGSGDPNNAEIFKISVESLYALAYRIKFRIKKSSMDIDYGVMPLEGLWWTEQMEEFSIKDKSNWKWTLMIFQPDFVVRSLVDECREEILKKKKLDSVSLIRFEKYTEGRSVQLLHSGPYSEEEENVRKIHEYIHSAGGSFGCFTGKHHEIYLSDARKTHPAKLKTIIRQPFNLEMKM